MGNQKKLKPKLILVAGLVVLIAITIGLTNSWQKNRSINQEIAGLKDNIKVLEKDGLELKELVEYFNSNAYIEEKARIDLGLKKAEEKVVVISQQREAGLTTDDSEAGSVADGNLSNPQKWWRYFFN